MSIEISVGLPMFRSKYIGWLALEGLTRQEDIDFEWEVVIAEETELNAMGYDEIMPYKERLYDAGCINITYIPLDEWIPLARKWTIIIDKCDKNSKIFTLLGADMYPPKRRIRNIYNAFQGDINFYGNSYDVMYDIKTENVAIYKQPPKGSGMTLLLKYARKIKPADIGATVDAWVYNNYKSVLDCDLKIFIDNTDAWKYGFNTNGLNNISNTLSRSNSVIGFKGSYDKPDFDIKENIPLEILTKLKNCKEYMKKHEERRKNNIHNIT